MSAESAFSTVNSLDTELRQQSFPTGSLLETCFLEIASWNHLLSELYYPANSRFIESQLDLLLDGTSIRISLDGILNSLDNRRLPSPFLFYKPNTGLNFIFYTLKLKAEAFKEWCREYTGDSTYISVWEYLNSFECFKYIGPIDINAKLEVGVEPTIRPIPTESVEGIILDDDSDSDLASDYESFLSEIEGLPPDDISQVERDDIDI